MTHQELFDLVIVGGGIVGLSTAMQFNAGFPEHRVLLLEKEGKLAQHQTGHNSGVIHSGVYYKPGSAKAEMCVSGATEMKRFCEEHAVPYSICGKVIVATSQDELYRLQTLYDRGVANGVSRLRLISRSELLEIEPHSTGIRALHVPTAAITDYIEVANEFAAIFVRRGGIIRTSTRVLGVSRKPAELIVKTSAGEVRSRFVINCAGLHSDVLARTTGRDGLAIVPFRGEYYDLAPSRQFLVKGLIYPVPDPNMPFLGVHFTRRVRGGVEAGPNAVLALKREGYWKTDVDLETLSNMVQFPGFWKMAKRLWRIGAGEYYRSFRKRGFLKALQKLLPELTDQDIQPGGSGVRAQAVDRDGNLIDDFRFEYYDRVLHVLNVPSPAATASLPIGRHLVELLRDTFEIRAHSCVS